MTPADFNPGREQVQVTAAPIIQSEKARFDPEGNVNKLMEALGTQNTQAELLKFNQEYEAKKLQEQTQKIDWYVSQFQQDHEGQAVSQAQIKERFPETVPVIAARVAETIGRQDGEKKMASVIDEINNNDSLRLDTAARANFLKQKRAELVGQIPEGNDFYGNGVVQSIDKQIAQNDMNWQAQTAAYHQKVQSDGFTAEVVTAINNNDDPKQALLDLDQKYGVSSSLNNIERKTLVVKTAIDTAFTQDDPKILEKIPTQFLNADSKKEIEVAKHQIYERRMGLWRDAQARQTAEREANTRANKTEITQDLAAGNPVDPAKYRNDPEAFTFAVQMRGTGMIDEAQSVANAQTYRQYILNQGTTGEGATLAELQDSILHHPTMNPREKVALSAELPALMEGRHILADESIRQPLNDVLMPAMRLMNENPNSQVQGMLHGRSLQAEATRNFQNGITRSFMAYYEDNHKWPTGSAKLNLINIEVDKAQRQIQSWTSISSMKDINKDAPAPVAAPAPAPKPAATTAAAPMALPKGVTLVK